MAYKIRPSMKTRKQLFDEGLKYCPRCVSVQPILNFGPRSNRKGVPYGSWCKRCLTEDTKQRYVPHPTPPRHDIASGNKVCSGCKQRRPLEEYYRRWTRPNSPYVAKCKSCALALSRRKIYGVDAGVYDSLFEEQDGACAICGVRSDKLFVDHDHRAETNHRGLLCMRCNLGIGYLQDDPDVVGNAALYLKKWRSILWS